MTRTCQFTLPRKRFIVGVYIIFLFGCRWISSIWLPRLKPMPLMLAYLPRIVTCRCSESRPTARESRIVTAGSWNTGCGLPGPNGSSSWKQFRYSLSISNSGAQQIELLQRFIKWDRLCNCETGLCWALLTLLGKGDKMAPSILRHAQFLSLSGLSWPSISGFLCHRHYWFDAFVSNFDLWIFIFY